MLSLVDESRIITNDAINKENTITLGISKISVKVASNLSSSLGEGMSKCLFL